MDVAISRFLERHLSAEFATAVIAHRCWTEYEKILVAIAGFDKSKQIYIFDLIRDLIPMKGRIGRNATKLSPKITRNFQLSATRPLNRRQINIRQESIAKYMAKIEGIAGELKLSIPTHDSLYNMQVKRRLKNDFSRANLILRKLHDRLGQLKVQRGPPSKRSRVELYDFLTERWLQVLADLPEGALKRVDVLSAQLASSEYARVSKRFKRLATLIHFSVEIFFGEGFAVPRLIGERLRLRGNDTPLVQGSI